MSTCPVPDATKRRGVSTHATKGVCQHLLEGAHHVILVHEGHLDIHLSELGLAIGAKVPVAEAFGNLVVALNATDHTTASEAAGLEAGVEVARLMRLGTKVSQRALGRI